MPARGGSAQQPLSWQGQESTQEPHFCGEFGSGQQPDLWLTRARQRCLPPPLAGRSTTLVQSNWQQQGPLFHLTTGTAIEVATGLYELFWVMALHGQGGLAPPDSCARAIPGHTS